MNLATSETPTLNLANLRNNKKKFEAESKMLKMEVARRAMQKELAGDAKPRHKGVVASKPSQTTPLVFPCSSSRDGETMLQLQRLAETLQQQVLH